MITIKNVSRVDGKREDLQFPSNVDFEMDGSRCLALPALMDPHVHFRVPGDSYKEDWKTASQAAINGGITFVCDMPNNTPAAVTVEALKEKRKLIDAELKMVDIPLGFGLYLGATSETLSEISKVKDEAIGVKIFMGGSTGNLLLDKERDQAEAFQRAADNNLVVAVHAEDEEILQKKKKEFQGVKQVALHSKIRDPKAAFVAVERALSLSEKYGTKLYILHVSTKEELDLIRQAKKRGVKVFAEATPHHLFLTAEDYKTLGTLAQMNPPLREKEDVNALWEALLDGTIDTIGTDHAPHTLEDKKRPYPDSPSGVPNIETYLPLLLDAHLKNRIGLNKLIELTHTNPRKLFNLKPTNDLVIVDLSFEKEVRNEELKTKCGWSPFSGWRLKGWPLVTVMNGRTFIQKKFQKK